MISVADPRSGRWRAATTAVHGGCASDPATRARATPIHLTASFTFEHAGQAAGVFGLDEPGYIYTRVGNPTTGSLESRVASLEEGEAALATASGQAAVAVTLLTLTAAGDEVVASTSLYSGSHSVLSGMLARLGVTPRFVDMSDLAALETAFSDRTRLVLAESVGNPQLDVLDVESVAAIAHRHGVPLVVDNSVPSPALCRPLRWGADIVVASATKYLGGHGTALGGVIVDGGTFDWGASDRFPGLAAPQPDFLGRSFRGQFGRLAFIARARVQALRDTGACLSPFNAFLLAQGLETLPLRMDRHCDSAAAAARSLAANPRVAWVNYPGLPDSPWHHLCAKYMGGSGGGLLTFGLKGGYEAGRRFIDGVRLCTLQANFGDSRTLVLHPASTSHRMLSEPQQRAAGVTPDLIRLSIGLEDVHDILEDIGQAIEASA
jgi:O-acetylhomoserine (thiol)-lyase